MRNGGPGDISDQGSNPVRCVLQSDEPGAHGAGKSWGKNPRPGQTLKGGSRNVRNNEVGASVGVV